MPQIEVDEPHAKPPRLPAFRSGSPWTGPLDPDRGLAELVGVSVDAGVHPIDEGDLARCSELMVEDSTLRGIGLGVEGGPQLEIRGSELVSCDLSQARVSVLQRSRLEGCKLAGTDLSAASLTDVEFARCTLRYTNLRMARLRRVRFVECTLLDVDGFQLELSDVSVDGCRLTGVNVDRLVAERVDLRGAAELGLSGVGRLDGCLVDDHQLPALAPLLALAVGLDLPLDPDPGVDSDR
ncbi:MAG: pentapeptide repeat-containing protein [Actinomycetota bacterium]